MNAMRAGRESCYRIHFLLHCSRVVPLTRVSADCRFFAGGCGPLGKSGDGVSGMILSMSGIITRRHLSEGEKG